MAMMPAAEEPPAAQGGNEGGEAPAPAALPPGQHSISGPTPDTFGASASCEAGAADAAGTAVVLPGGDDRIELTSGPHLRAAIVGVCVVLWLLLRAFGGQLQIYALPAMLLCTMSTSALWCTSNDIVLSLGPVPTCFFRRRIPYKDIDSIAIVRGRLHVLVALLRQGITRPWQPHGYIYGLTLGKDLIDVTMRDGAEVRKRDRLFPRRLLVSVDEADNVVAHVRFRQQYGAQMPLLTPEPRHQAIAGPVRWVLCDACDILLQPWRTMEPLALWRSDGHDRTA